MSPTRVSVEASADVRLLAAASGTEHNGLTEQALIEPLSGRELDVLPLLGSEMDGPAIARELMVSLNTMRTRTNNIYAKLGVTNRRAAARRVRAVSPRRRRARGRLPNDALIVG